MAMIHVSRSGAILGVYEEEKVREGLRTGEFIGTDLGWMEGMPTWRPLSELESFRAPATATPPPPIQANPEAAGAGTATPAAQPLAPAATVEPTTGRTGLPWENRDSGNFFNAIFDTISLVLTKPDQAFSIMKRDAGLGDPLLYLLILGIAGAIVSFAYSAITHSIGLFADRESGLASLLGFGVGSIFMLLLMPIFIMVGIFIGSAITHVCLMIVGGANQSFETTLRVLSYGQGSATVLQIIPVCGGLIAAVVALVVNCIGLARAHETDTWRAVVAILLPGILCCGGIIVIVTVLVGGLAGLNWH